MGKINSKKKGNRGELECVKLLTEVIGEGFARVPSSGAWAGGQNRERREDMSIEQKLTLVADIMTPPSFKFVLEHKNYESIDFWDLFNEGSKLNEWTEQVSGDAEFVGKHPMLIMKFNRHKRIVMTRFDFDGMYRFRWYDNKEREWYCSWFEDTLKVDKESWFE